MTYLAIVVLLLVVCIEIPAIFRYIKAINNMSRLVLTYEKQNDLTDEDVRLLQHMVKSVYGPHKVWWGALVLPWRLLHYQPDSVLKSGSESLCERHPNLYENFYREWHRALFFAGPTIWLISMVQVFLIVGGIMIYIAICGNVRNAVHQARNTLKYIGTQIFIKC